jgi:hypothetical protein
MLEAQRLNPASKLVCFCLAAHSAFSFGFAGSRKPLTAGRFPVNTGNLPKGMSMTAMSSPRKHSAHRHFDKFPTSSQAPCATLCAMRLFSGRQRGSG